MSKVIQMVVKPDGESIFITGYNEDDGIMTFRASSEPTHKQSEDIVITDETVYTNLYNFSVQYLQKFMHENKIQ